MNDIEFENLKTKIELQNTVLNNCLRNIADISVRVDHLMEDLEIYSNRIDKTKRRIEELSVELEVRFNGAN